jgi:hypothetical protein
VSAADRAAPNVQTFAGFIHLPLAFGGRCRERAPVGWDST